MNFAFSLVDATRATLARAMGAWAAWRHEREISNGTAVSQPSVEAALDTMLAALGKGDKIEHVWVYTDGDDQGRMIAPLTKGGASAGIDPTQASTYAQNSAQSKKLVKFASDATTLHLYGCHANLSKDSLGAWREVFTGAKGLVVAPDGFWQLALRSESWIRQIPADQKDGCRPKAVTIAPKDRADYQAGLRRIETTVDSLVDAGCLAQDRADAVKEQQGAAAIRHFDKLLRDWFDLLQPAGELPPSLRTGTPSRDVFLDAMWALWGGAGGIVFPFIAQKRVRIEATRGKTPKDLAADKSLLAAVPNDPGWGKKFVSRPVGVAQARDAARGLVTGGRMRVYGGLSLSDDALSDVIPTLGSGNTGGGRLFAPDDLNHISFKGDRLGYDPDYANPADPFRWQKIKDLVDSGVAIRVDRVTVSETFSAIVVENGTRSSGPYTVAGRPFFGTGVTLAPESLAKKHWDDKLMALSPDGDLHIYYSKDDLAHELLGHAWLLVKGLPWLHAQMITKGMSVQTPLGETYTGKVIDFLKYVDAPFAAKSPTLRVSPSHLSNAMGLFKTEFPTKATGTMKDRTVNWPGEIADLFKVLAANYDVAPAAGSGKTISQKGIFEEIKTWYSQLSADEQYRFLFLLNAVPLLTLASDLSAKLPQPAGMPGLPQPLQAP